MHLFTTTKIKQHFPYRTARGTGMMIEIPYDRDDAIHKFEKGLCQDAKVGEDNHHGFLVEGSRGQTLFLWFRDWSLMVCTGYDEAGY